MQNEGEMALGVEVGELSSWFRDGAVSPSDHAGPGQGPEPSQDQLVYGEQRRDQSEVGKSPQERKKRFFIIKHLMRLLV